MRRILPILIAIILACIPLRSASTQTRSGADEDVVAVLERMRDAFRSGNQSDLLRHLETLDRLTSNHPIIVFQLARTRAMLGDTAGALATLQRLAPMGLAAPIATDSAFRILRSHPDFSRIAEDLSRAAAPLVRSDTAFVASDPDLLPESVAFDSVERAWYLGSLAHHKVVRVAADGSARGFAAAEGRGRVIGIKIDSPRRRLWMLETTIDSAAPRTYGGMGGWTSLRGYDLATGREIARHAPSDREGPHLFNDLAVSAAGDVYVTDLFGNAVWGLRAGADSLEMVARGPRFHWPNGITLSPDGSRLYAAHIEGISAIDPRTGAITDLPHPPTAAMADIDGLYACGSSLIAIQRMADFQQVSRFVLSPSGDSIVAMEAIERSHPAYVDPTTGVMIGGDLFYIANAQFRRLLPDHTLAPAARPHGTVILRLAGVCR